MATNSRIFYGCQGVLAAESGSSLAFLKGVQSVGVTPTQDATTLSDVGRTQTFAVFYNNPTIEITIERVLEKSGDPRFFTLGASPGSYLNSYFLKSSNFGMQNTPSETDIKQYDIRLLYTSDASDDIAAGSAVDTYDFKYCLLTAISYSLAVDGLIKETLTFTTKIQDHTSGGSSSSETFPQTATNMKRQDVSISTATLPDEVEDIIDAYSDTHQAVQSININLNINYGQLTDVGKWRGASAAARVNDFRYIQLPIEVSSSFTIIARRGMQQDILMKDTNFMSDVGVPDRQIIIPVQTNADKYIFWDLGQKNYLTNVSTAGGDVGGGNVEMTFDYVNTNNDYVAYGPLSSKVTLTPSKL